MTRILILLIILVQPEEPDNRCIHGAWFSQAWSQKYWIWWA